MINLDGLKESLSDTPSLQSSAEQQCKEQVHFQAIKSDRSTLKTNHVLFFVKQPEVLKIYTTRRNLTASHINVRSVSITATNRWR